VAPELERIVLACLEKEPAKRPASAAELGAMLEACPLETRWTPAKARAFFEENRDAIARANPATLAARALAERGVATATNAPESTASDASPPKKDAPLERLQHHFTRSHIDVNELELRMLRVKKAKTAQEIERVFADLPPLEAPPKEPAQRGSVAAINGSAIAGAMAGSAAVATIEPRRDKALVVRGYHRHEMQVVSVMSSNRRDITLRDGEVGTAVAVMGEATVFVDASRVTADGIAELKCVAVMGHLTIYVKAGVEVEAAGVGVLGYFERWGGRRRSRQGPILRVTGAAVLGGVKVVVAEEE
jgi:hypothetical protein